VCECHVGANEHERERERGREGDRDRERETEREREREREREKERGFTAHMSGTKMRPFVQKKEKRKKYIPVVGHGILGGARFEGVYEQHKNAPLRTKKGEKEKIYTGP